MRISVVTAPAGEAASLEEVKGHLRVDSADDDTYIHHLIEAATDRVEAYTGRRLIEQTLDVFFEPGFVLCREIELPVAPVSAVTSIEVTGTDGTTTTVDAGDYSLIEVDGPRGDPPFVRLGHDKQWPTADGSVAYPVKARVTAGYGTMSTNVPEALRQAIFTMVGGWYEARQDLIQGGAPGQYSAPMVSDLILDPYRLAWVV